MKVPVLEQIGSGLGHKEEVSSNSDGDDDANLDDSEDSSRKKRAIKQDNASMFNQQMKMGETGHKNMRK